MHVIQILILFFCVIALLGIWRRAAAGKINRIGAAMWSLLWIAVGVVVLQPEFTTVVAGLVGVGRGVDLVIYLSLLGILAILFRLYSRLEEVEREITRLVRTLALERAGIEEDGRSGDGPPAHSTREHDSVD